MPYDDNQQLSSGDTIEVREGDVVEEEDLGEEEGELDMSDEPRSPYDEDTNDEMDMTLYSMYPNEENKGLYY